MTGNAEHTEFSTMHPDRWLPDCWVTLSKLRSFSVAHSSISHIEALAWSKFNYFIGHCVTMLRHGKLSEQYVPYGMFPVHSSCCHYCSKYYCCSTFPWIVFQGHSVKTTLTHRMDLAVSLQPFRASRTQ